MALLVVVKHLLPKLLLMRQEPISYISRWCRAEAWGLCHRCNNRPEVMDRAVLRPGRFGKLLYVPLPTPDERSLILKALGRRKPIDPGVDLLAIGKSTACENISGADLAALMNEAAMAALEEKFTSEISNSDASPCTIKATHFEQARCVCIREAKALLRAFVAEPARGLKGHF